VRVPGFCQHSRQSRFFGNLVALGLTKMTESDGFLLFGVIEIARYGKFGANAAEPPCELRRIRIARNPPLAVG
jgi:hypothetical protein